MQQVATLLGWETVHPEPDEEATAYEAEENAIEARVVRTKDNGFGFSVSPVRQLASDRQAHSIVCVFSVEKASLDDPDLSFVFNHAQSRMPSIDFIYARLKNYYETPTPVVLDGPHHQIQRCGPPRHFRRGWFYRPTPRRCRR